MCTRCSIFFPGAVSGYILTPGQTGDPLLVSARMCDGTNQTGWASVSSFGMDNTGVATVEANSPARGRGVIEDDDFPVEEPPKKP